MPRPLTLTNVHRLDLDTGSLSRLADLHVVEGRIARAPGEGAEVVDGGGGVVMPGLWDAHTHLAQWAMSSRWVDVSAATSPQHAARLMAAALPAATDDEQVLVGFGFRDSTWAQSPTAADLDAQVADRPVVVISNDVHSTWLNSAALAHFGVADETGLLQEQAAFDLQTRLATAPDEVVDRWVDQAARQAAGRGVVGVVDLGMAWNPGEWRRRCAAGFQGLRVRAGVYPQHLDRVAEQRLRGGQRLDERGLVTLGPLKIITDGSLTARTAWCREPYRATGTGDPLPGQEHGVCSVGLEELVWLMHRATGLGLECAVHAIGDRAVAQVLDGFTETGSPGSLEHAQLVGPSDITRMAALGVRASVQPAHLLDDRDAMDTLWAGRTHHAFPLAQMAAAGVELALGSDAPVARLDPWLAIEVAVRRTLGSREPWHPEQALGLSQALKASTGGVGSLVVGAEADLVVLPVNPFEVPADQLHAIAPALTMLAGRLTWQ
ncbi:amidohydrolase [Propionibacteriaceae bacterium Y1923]